MAGQLWGVERLGGFMYSDQLSQYLRKEVQPMMRFRQFCSAKEAFTYGRGDIFHWDIFTNVRTQGGRLKEGQALPETNFEIRQGSLQIDEFGNSVPYTKKLDNLSKVPVENIIQSALKDDCAKTLDYEAYNQFNQTRLVASPVSGTSATQVNIEAVAAAGDHTATVNDAALSLDHVKAIIDEMKERNIPGYDGDDYFALARPTTFRPIRNEIEELSKYVESGWRNIRLGEIGKYEGCRFVEQTNIPSKGWTNGKSDEAFFFGGDTVTEAVTDPEQIRGKLPTDYGRSKGVAWYYMGGFGIVHNQSQADDPQALQNRIIRWDSAS